MIDVIRFCDVIDNCTECPRYGDDCDGDKRVEHTDYISRADAMAEFSEWVKRANENGETPTWNDAVSLIGSLPSAEAVQGKWIMHIDDLFPCESTQECSVCHAEQLISISDDNFCQNCGARMIGGDIE